MWHGLAEIISDSQSSLSHLCDVTMKKAGTILDSIKLSLVWSCDLLIDVQVLSDDLNRNRSCLNSILKNEFSFLPQTWQSLFEEKPGCVIQVGVVPADELRWWLHGE